MFSGFFVHVCESLEGGGKEYYRMCSLSTEPLSTRLITFIPDECIIILLYMSFHFYWPFFGYFCNLEAIKVLHFIFVLPAFGIILLSLQYEFDTFLCTSYFGCFANVCVSFSSVNLHVLSVSALYNNHLIWCAGTWGFWGKITFRFLPPFPIGEIFQNVFTVISAMVIPF